MTPAIEDHALISNCRTAALVTNEGTIDWLCLPRLDSASVFGSLLGDADDGQWSIRPVGDARSHRRYDGDTFVLVTRWETDEGVAEIHDFMPVGPDPHATIERTDLVRRVVGVSGHVDFQVDLRVRFDYARAMPWIRKRNRGEADVELIATAGPDALVLRGPELEADDHRHRSRFRVAADDTVDFTLTWYPSFRPVPKPLDIDRALAETRDWWKDWASRIDHDGAHNDLVVRSLLTLRALTNHDTGGIAAAATTSLPEDFGGERNWDYRFVWLRDAALTLESLLTHGFTAVADAWRTWLLRAIAGDPADVQIMYGLAGERDLLERELPHLAGYANSRPVRVGNGAVDQYQADVVGEVLVTLYSARKAGLEESPYSWPLERHLIEYAAEQLERPDNGMWEIRGEPRMFTHSRAMLWATFDRGIRTVEEFGLTGPVERWRELRDRIRAEIDDRGVSSEGYFTQHYDTDEVDASLLVLPQVGFCEPDDPRMLATVEKIEQTLMHHGLVLRYRTDSGVDGLVGDEHPFLACSFWLVEQYASTGRDADANELMSRLCSLPNDVGLLAEEYDPVEHRQVGNFPQAFSHLALVRAADALERMAVPLR